MRDSRRQSFSPTIPVPSFLRSLATRSRGNMFNKSTTIDVEKDAQRGGSSGDGAVAGETFEYGNSTYAKLQRVAGKLHVEQRGIERVPDDERDDHSLLNVGTMVNPPLPLLSQT